MSKNRKSTENRQLLIVPSGIAEDSVEAGENQAVMSEFDIQKTAESENFFPVISQGYPISGFKDAVENDKTR